MSEPWIELYCGAAVCKHCFRAPPPGPESGWRIVCPACSANLYPTDRLPPVDDGSNPGGTSLMIAWKGALVDYVSAPGTPAEIEVASLLEALPTIAATPLLDPLLNPAEPSAPARPLTPPSGAPPDDPEDTFAGQTDAPATPAAPRTDGEDATALEPALSRALLTESVEELIALATHDDVAVRQRVAWNPLAPSALLAQLALEVELHAAVAAHEATPATILAQLAASASVDVRCAVVTNPSTPAAVLATLAEDPEPLVRASHPDTPAEELATLARHEREDVRVAVARNRGTWVDDLRLLANDPSAAVCTQVAWNKYTPSEALALLESRWRADASDAGRWLREMVARNHNTSAQTLWHLARRHVLRPGAAVDDPWRPSLVSAIAGNPQAPVDLLRRLLDADTSSAFSRVLGNPAAPAALLEELVARHADQPVFGDDAFARLAAESSAALRLSAAQRACAGRLESWRALAVDPEHDVRAAVAGNPRTPPAVLADLAGDLERGVVLAALGNPSTPGDVLAACAEHPDPACRETIARNAALPVATLARLADDPDARVRLRVASQERTPAPQLESLSQSSATALREAVAYNPSAPAIALARLALDPEESVRKNLALNPCCPSEVQARLAADPSQHVRRALVLGRRKQQLRGG